ncbi:MAG: serine/threonine-protein kinase [Pirellulaceae bacterium]
MAIDKNYIGSYRLLKLVRAGAKCQIWEALHEVDNQRCALKALAEDHRSNREEIALLKHEYAVGKDLEHTNVIRIFDFNVVKGIPHLAMEYFDSQNLKQWLRDLKDAEKDPDVTVLKTVIQQAAAGLAYLHDEGWIHRDIKPDNFLVNDQYHVKLIDFAIARKIKSGLAKLFSGKAKVQGTRSYMSPEQIRGKNLDERSDVYSFGCVLFEMHCGRPPYTGGSPDELLTKHLRASVPSMAANCSFVGAELTDLVSRMMAKNPDQRPDSMDQFLAEFNRIRNPWTTN